MVLEGRGGGLGGWGGGSHWGSRVPGVIPMLAEKPIEASTKLHAFLQS